MINDLLDVASQFGASGVGGFSKLEGEDAEQARNAVSDSSITIVTGADDRLLRSIEMHVSFDIPKDVELDDSVKALFGSDLTFQLDTSNPNEPVHVEPPENAEPLGG